MRRSVHALALAGALALTLAACASSKATGLPAGPTEGPAGGGTEVRMPGATLKFDPEELTVNVGDTVTWINNGSLPHTVTSEDGKLFDSGTSDLIDAGEEFEFTFKAVGSYPYYCALHAARGARSGMIGTIVVQAGTGGGAGTASPSPSPTT